MKIHGGAQRMLLAVGAGALVIAMSGCTDSAQPAPQSQVSNFEPELVEPAQPTQELAGLERVPWEGGPEYWKQFDRAREAGWASEDFFPIVSWFNGISSNEEVAFDKSLGLNTYIGMAEETPYRLFADNDVFYIGPKLNETYDKKSVNWVGQLLGDELDGQFGDPAEGLAHLQQQAQKVPSGFFKYTNFTQLVIGNDMDSHASENYVNGPLDVASLDMYWYTVPFCSNRPYRNIYLEPVSKDHCRSASSYGKAVKALWLRDGVDGEHKPIWQFVENYNGGPGGQPLVATIKPKELEGAVVSSLINEARGILYFNQSLSGDCQTGNVFRETQLDPKFCAADTVKAAARVNAKIHDLARVLNTQSYVHDFGTGLQSMLKADDGYAYIFAMTDGESQPGERVFHLPKQISGHEIEVLYEKRSIMTDDQGIFTDEFAEESTYHIYKVKL